MPCKRPRGLVAVAAAELGQPQRQVTIGLEALIKDLHVAGAVHGLHCELTLLGLEREHAFGELVSVTRALPQTNIHHLRRFDFLIAKR